VISSARFGFVFQLELRFLQKRLGNFMLAMGSGFTAFTVLLNAVGSLLIEKENWMLLRDLWAPQ
jgi:hypothetical protein